MSAAPSKTKKTTPSKSKTAAKSKGAAKSATHPPFADIIRECIADAGDRTGVSRPTIKKYIEEKYKMEVTASVISNINRSIAYGAEKGTFVLPKGPSGKVKLAPKKTSSSDAAKENNPTKPAAPAKKVASKPAASKSVAKPTKKTTTATKKSTAATKKTTPLAKKTTKPAAAAKKTSTKRAPAKKAITGSAKAKPATKAKSPAKKKTSSAAAPASKRKSTSTAKPTSKAKPASPKK